MKRPVRLWGHAVLVAALVACGGPEPRARGSGSSSTSEPADGTQRAPLPAPEARPTSDWPSFRGPRASGTSDTATPVTTWEVDSRVNVRWASPIPGYSHSSPVISRDTVFVATAVSFAPAADGRRDGVRNKAISDFVEREWKIYALAVDDGRVLWERTARSGMPRVKRHEKASHANPTPATDGRHVVAVFNSEGLFCWSSSGELLWSRDLGRLDPGYWGQPDNNWGHASSPVLFENMVVVQSDDFADSFLAAYRLEDGSEIWRVDRDELATWATPLIHGTGEAAILVAQGGNHVRAYDPHTGKELWNFADQAEVKVPSPIAYRGLLILSGGAPSGRPVFALQPDAAQREAAATPELRWRIASGGPYTPTPLAYGDLLYVARDGGILSVYELASGAPVYRQRLGTGFSASPVGADGRIYLASEDGSVFVVRAGREFELLASNDMGEPLFATPALSRDWLIVRTTTRLYGLGPTVD